MLQFLTFWNDCYWIYLSSEVTDWKLMVLTIGNQTLGRFPSHVRPFWAW
jgi:hypothetical protein